MRWREKERKRERCWIPLTVDISLVRGAAHLYHWIEIYTHKHHIKTNIKKRKKIENRKR